MSQPIAGTYRLNPGLSITASQYAYNYVIIEQKQTVYGLSVFVMPTTTIKTGKPATFGQCAKQCTWILLTNLTKVSD